MHMQNTDNCIKRRKASQSCRVYQLQSVGEQQLREKPEESETKLKSNSDDATCESIITTSGQARIYTLHLLQKFLR